MSIYSWEEKYKRTWESPQTFAKSQNKHLFRTVNKDTKRALIRHLCIAIDKSENIDSKDFLPSFRLVTKQKLDIFYNKFKTENPVSKLSFYIQTNNATQFNDTESKKLQNTNNVHSYATTTRLLNTPGIGTFSLYNTLENSYNHLKNSSNIKELLIICYSITIKDPFDIQEILQKYIKNNIIVNVVSFCGELKVLQTVCMQTNGSFYVPLDTDHFEEILNTFLLPKSIVNSTVSLLKIGFPKKIDNGVCICHLKYSDSVYSCVQCKAFLCDLPTECLICNTHNVSSINLNKNMHHLQCLNEFDVYTEGSCSICNQTCKKRCTNCNSLYCKDCSDFLHNEINFCINCG